MSAQALVQHLLAWVQQETAIQGKLAGALEQLEQALRAGVREEVVTAVGTLEALAAECAPSRARGRGILDACARAWSLGGSLPTLAQVIERAAGEDARVATLERMRAELRQRVTSVVKGGRRVGALVRHQRGLCQELRGVLTGQPIGQLTGQPTGQDSLGGQAAEGILA